MPTENAAATAAGNGATRADANPEQPQQIDALALLFEDAELITYRPRIKRLVGSVTGAVLLQQVLYWWHRMGRQPFYKFNAPCRHALYQPGDDWESELAFSRYEREGALKKMATKVSGPVDNFEEQPFTAGAPTALVAYWTDAARLTWWQVNEGLLSEMLVDAYGAKPPKAKRKKTSGNRVDKPAGTPKANVEFPHRSNGEKPHPLMGKNHISTIYTESNQRDQIDAGLFSMFIKKTGSVFDSYQQALKYWQSKGGSALCLFTEMFAPEHQGGGTRWRIEPNGRLVATAMAHALSDRAK